MTTTSDAPTTREAKRYATARRLQRCALEMTIARGFDGWTMDDLAHAAEVSRRTVFNYFPGKAEVILGPEPDHDPAKGDLFRAGGPTGDLLEDVLVLAREATEEKAEDAALLPAVRQAILADGRLLGLVHQRFEAMTALLTEAIVEREGADFPATRARLMSRLLLTFLDDAIDRAGADTGHAFPDLIDAAVADARALLTRTA